MPRETTTALAVALAAALAPERGRADDAHAPRAADPVGPVVVSARLELIRGPGAERCPAERKLHEEVARRLGYDPFASGAEGRFIGRVRATLARSPRGLTATSELLDPAGASRWIRTYTVRGTSTRDCELAVVGAAVEIAAELTLFDEPEPPPARDATAPAPPACLQPQPEPADRAWSFEPAAPCVQPQEWTTRPPERAPLSFLVGASIWPEWVAKQEGWFGLGVDAGLRYRDFSLRVEAHGDPPLDARQVYVDGSLSSARVMGTLVLCGHFSPFISCFKWDAGAILFPHPVPGASPRLYRAIGGRLGVEYPVARRRLLLRTVFDLSIPIHPANVETPMRGDPLFTIASPNFGLAIGVVWEVGLR